MAQTLKDLIKKVVISATAAISATGMQSIKAAEDTTVGKIPELSHVIKSAERDFLIPKFILKTPQSINLTNTFCHRSHRSHSSHRSHYSSYTPSKQPEENRTRAASESSSSETVAKSNTDTRKNQVIYELGSRTLEKGMKGTDVAELEDILSEKGYKGFKKDGYFDEELEKAVKEFQKKNDVTPDGKVDVMTLYYLKKK